jgi:putative tricarboxylic transport membrane protein
MQDVMGARVDLMCDQTTNTTSNIKANKIKVFAVTTPKRVPSLPNVPTASEAGLANFEVGIWHGVYAPKGTPAPIIDRLTASLKKALKDPALVERFEQLGTAPVAEADATPAALKAKTLGEIDRWAPIIHAAGQYAE